MARPKRTNIFQTVCCPWMEPACRFGSNNRAPLWFCWFVARTRRIGCVTSDCTTRVGVDASRQCTTRCRFRIKLRAAGRKGPIAREVRRMVWQGRDQQQWCPLIQGWTLILHWVWALNSTDLTASWKSIPKSLTIFICRPTKKLSRTTGQLRYSPFLPLLMLAYLPNSYRFHLFYPPWELHFLIDHLS